ncbi:hypothetical protein [Candidatus Viadribacter manganicus]|uniref:Uncharacterized protein n=1 Tax=Candidatus Viadribacter manganicus TaxID=1759059 RepID=A0A1B1AML5_9PROT|nr:hypothetical protein [Candidatus Viadribacter manganicus]ANP47796.1 hypothetical protein ATE48_18775 [Candidatus Viadribacter manganicus]
MSQEQPEPEGQPQKDAGPDRRNIEIAAWVFSPLLLIIAASVVAVLLGAPWLRSVIVFAVASLSLGLFLFHRPQSWMRVGKIRSAGLMYSGVGTLVLAIIIPVIAASQTPHGQAARAGRGESVVAQAPTTQALVPQRADFYPWAYSVSPLTLRCINSTGYGAGEVVATSSDDREFGVTANAISAERPSLATLRREGSTEDAVDQLSRAGLRLCQGPDRPSFVLIASEGTPPPPPPSPWVYTSDVDEMSDQRISHACTMSTNIIQLEFPYPAQRVTLCVRQHPRWGQDVIVRLERGGQFLCTSYRACTVRVRFDEGEASAYSALEPSDNSSDAIFIQNDARFIANLRRSSRVIVEANFFQAGAQRMNFDTSQFEWPRRER